MAGKKTSEFTNEGIESLAKNKPVVYKIDNNKGEIIYTGIAKRDSVKDRLKEHLPGGNHPIKGGEKIKIIQKNSIDEAKKTEERIIKREQPTQNIKGN